MSRQQLTTSTNQKGLPLTERQSAVLMYYAQGLRTKQIAHELEISEATVSKHVSAIHAKLGTDTIAQAVWEYAKASVWHPSAL